MDDFFAVLALSLQSLAAETQMQMNQEADEAFQKSDRELNRIYQQILDDKAYKQDKVFLSAFKEAQRAWLKFRDASLRAKYPHQESGYSGYYGSVHPMCVSEFLAELTRKRVEELTEWARGEDEGDVCVGSIKRR